MLNVFLDTSVLTQISKTMEPEAIKQLAQRAARDTAAAAHAHIIERANSRLHSRLKPYLSGLSFSQEDDDTWVIVLDKSVRWIDDGMEPHSMVEDLLSPRGGKGQVHTSKDGHKWRVIPFAHGPGKGTTTTTPAQQSLISTIKQEMSQRKIPWAKMEKDESGQPKLGMLHSFNISSGPLKTHNGPGQGWGPVGQVKQGPTGIPFLHGVRVYQHKVKDDKGNEKVKRSVMTFRIVSSKHAGSKRWFHPGLPAENLFEEAAEWAQREWSEKALPQLIDALLTAGR